MFTCAVLVTSIYLSASRGPLSLSFSHLAALSLTVFIFLHICWGVLWFDAFEKKSYLKGAIVLLSHSAVAILVSCVVARPNTMYSVCAAFYCCVSICNLLLPPPLSLLVLFLLHFSFISTNLHCPSAYPILKSLLYAACPPCSPPFLFSLVSPPTFPPLSSLLLSRHSLLSTCTLTEQYLLL